MRQEHQMTIHDVVNLCHPFKVPIRVNTHPIFQNFEKAVWDGRDLYITLTQYNQLMDHAKDDLETFTKTIQVIHIPRIENYQIMNITFPPPGSDFEPDIYLKQMKQKPDEHGFITGVTK